MNARRNSTVPATPEQDEPATNEPKAFTVPFPLDLTFSAHGHTVALSDLPTATMIYLMANGFSSTLTDAGTTSAAKVVQDAIKEENKRRKEANLPLLTRSEETALRESLADDVAAASTANRAKRVDALLEGSMVWGSRGPNGPKRSAKDQWIWDRVESDLTHLAKTNGFTMPKGAELTTMIQAEIDDNAKALSEAYEAHVAAIAADEERKQRALARFAR